MVTAKEIASRLSWLVFVLCFLSIKVRAGNYCMPSISQEVIVISIQSEKEAMIGKDTFDMEGLTHELQQRYWKTYLGTGKTSIELKVRYLASPSVAEEKIVTSAIKKGLQDALSELCLQLHKQPFEELSERQQNKIKKQFPALFQQKF